MTSTVEAASLNYARSLRFEAFATIETFGVMSSWSLVGTCYANFAVDVKNKCEISGSQSGTAEDSGLPGCDTSNEGPAVLRSIGNYSPRTRLYVPEDLEDRRNRLFRNISDHVPDCTVSSQ